MPTTMQKPSVGRVVHYNDHGRRIAAIITFVHDDSRVELFPFGGTKGWLAEATFELEVVVAGPNAMSTTPGTWSWPPFVPPHKPAV